MKRRRNKQRLCMCSWGDARPFPTTQAKRWGGICFSTGTSKQGKPRFEVACVSLRPPHPSVSPRPCWVGSLCITSFLSSTYFACLSLFLTFGTLTLTSALPFANKPKINPGSSIPRTPPLIFTTYCDLSDFPLSLSLEQSRLNRRFRTTWIKVSISSR